MDTYVRMREHRNSGAGMKTIVFRTSKLLQAFENNMPFAKEKVEYLLYRIACPLHLVILSINEFPQDFIGYFR